MVSEIEILQEDIRSTFETLQKSQQVLEILLAHRAPQEECDLVEKARESLVARLIQLERALAEQWEKKHPAGCGDILSQRVKEKVLSCQSIQKRLFELKNSTHQQRQPPCSMKKSPASAKKPSIRKIRQRGFH